MQILTPYNGQHVLFMVPFIKCIAFYRNVSVYCGKATFKQYNGLITKAITFERGLQHKVTFNFH